MEIHTPSLRSAELSGVMLAASSFAFMTGADTLIKLLASGHPPYQLLAINGMFGLIPVFARAVHMGGLENLITAKAVQHLLRGGASYLSSILAIYAYSRLSLTGFYAIVFAGPLLVTLLSALWLKEAVDRARWIAISIGFCGILVVVNPFRAVAGEGFAVTMTGRVAALASVFCYAVSVIMIRRMRVGETSMTFSFFGYIAAIGSGLVLWLIFEPAGFTALEIAHLFGAGICSGIASLCLMEAYHRAPVAIVAPFQYTQIFWGALVSYLLWHTVPTASLITGACIVAASGLFVIYRDMRGKLA